MDSPAAEYLRGIVLRQSGDFSLDEFVRLCEANPSKASKREAVEYLLRAISLSPSDIQVLAKSALVRHSIDLQYVLKKYVSNKLYRDEEKARENKSGWLLALEMLSGASLI